MADTANSEKIRDKRLANLRPFQPGQSGNPSGRPRKHLSDAYAKVLERDAEKIADALSKKACSGDYKAAAELADRVEGKPAQTHNVNANVSVDAATRRERIRQAIAILGGSAGGQP